MRTRTVNARTVCVNSTDWFALIAAAVSLSVASVQSAWAQVTIAGVPGVADQHVIVDFSALPSAISRPSGVSGPRHKIFPHMPGPTRHGVARNTNGAVENSGSVNFITPSPFLPSPPLMDSFDPLGDNDMAIPPDTNGALGPNHLFVTLNTQIAIQTRAGVTLSTALQFRSLAATNVVPLPTKGSNLDNDFVRVIRNLFRGFCLGARRSRGEFCLDQHPKAR